MSYGVVCVHKRQTTYYPILASIVCVCMCKHFFPFINYKTMNKQPFDEQTRQQMWIVRSWNIRHGFFCRYHSTLYGDLFVESHKITAHKNRKECHHNAHTTSTTILLNFERHKFQRVHKHRHILTHADGVVQWKEDKEEEEKKAANKELFNRDWENEKSRMNLYVLTRIVTNWPDISRCHRINITNCDTSLFIIPRWCIQNCPNDYYDDIESWSVAWIIFPPSPMWIFCFHFAIQAMCPCSLMWMKHSLQSNK